MWRDQSVNQRNKATKRVGMGKVGQNFKKGVGDIGFHKIGGVDRNPLLIM